jgi:hypothetical protein
VKPALVPLIDVRPDLEFDILIIQKFNGRSVGISNIL